MIGSLVKNAAGSAVAFMLAAPAMADVQVEFVEGAPKDRFVLRNASDCSLSAATVRLDLSSSQGGPIFDVTGGGREITVSGAEIQGTTVSLEGAKNPQSGVFSSASRAAIPVGTC